MLKISQIGRFANQFRHTNNYQYLTSQILSQSRCGVLIEPTKVTQPSTTNNPPPNEVDSCGCAIRINQRVGLCQLGRSNDHNAGDAPLKSSCLWVVDKATPWFIEQREQQSQWNASQQLPSLGERCKLLGITSTTEAENAQLMALQKPILEAQEQRLDPNKFKHISPEFLSLLREHDNLCLQKNPFYGLPPRESVHKRDSRTSDLTNKTADGQQHRRNNRGTTMCRHMNETPSKSRSKCFLSSYLAAKKNKRKQTSCSEDRDSKFKRGDPHVPAYRRASKASRLLKSFFAGTSPNASFRSRKERYANEKTWRALRRPSGFFRHTHSAAYPPKDRKRSVSVMQAMSMTGFHRHPISHLKNLKKCDHTTPYFNDHSIKCKSDRSRRSRSSSCTPSQNQNLGFHRRSYGRSMGNMSSRCALNQSAGGVNRTWDYGIDNARTNEMSLMAKGFYRHTYDSASPVLRSRSRSRSRSKSKSKSPPRKRYQSPYRDQSRSRGSSPSKSSLCSSKSKEKCGTRRRSQCCLKRKRSSQPVREIWMKPKTMEMRQSQSRCCLKRGRSPSKKCQSQVKFYSGSNKYYNEPHVHAYNDSAMRSPSGSRSGSKRKQKDAYKRGSSDGSDSDSEGSDNRRVGRRTEGSRHRFDSKKDKRSKDSKKKKAAAAGMGGLACRRKRRNSDGSENDTQTDDDICYPPLPITPTQKARMIDEALNRFVPEPEDPSNEQLETDSTKNKKDAKGKSGKAKGKSRDKSADDKTRGKSKAKGKTADDLNDDRKGARSRSGGQATRGKLDSRRSRSSISINDTMDSSKSVESLGPYGEKWPSRMSSQAPRLPLAAKKCGHKLVRDPAAPKKVKRKTSWSSCRSSRSNKSSDADDVSAYRARRRQIQMRAHNSSEFDDDKCRRRRKTPLLVGVEPKHHICHKDSNDWTKTTKNYPSHLRYAGMEKRCENITYREHRCTTKQLMHQHRNVSRKESKHRQNRHDLCRKDSQDWSHAKRNYPLSYQIARNKAKADANMLRHHRDKTEKILSDGYTPHRHAAEAKAKRLRSQADERGTPKRKRPIRQLCPLRPNFYAPKRDFSQDWEALKKHEACLPPVQRLQLFREQHKQEAAASSKNAEKDKADNSCERPARRPPYDPGEEMVRRNLEKEEKLRRKSKRENTEFYHNEDDYYREAEAEECARRARKRKEKPLGSWPSEKQSVTILCSPEPKSSSYRPTPPPKPKKKYNPNNDEQESTKSKRSKDDKRRWFDDFDSPTVSRCVADRAEMRCVRRERRLLPPCQPKPEYILGQPKHDRRSAP